MSTEVQNTTSSQHDAKLPVVSSAVFKIGDRVENSGAARGTVWKISDEAVHVRYDDGMFQKFHFKPYHHKQSPISELRHCL